MRGSTRTVAAVAGAALVLALAGCGSSSSTSTTAAPPALPPLTTSVAGVEGTWAVVPMGTLSQPNDTFWQAFYRPAGAAKWILRTPPGVADNGGLVISASVERQVIGFRPSNQLRYSPLAISTDQGASYAPALLPPGLADVPDALSVPSSGPAVALSGSEVFTASSDLSTWTPSTSLQALETSAAGSRCGVTQISAVATATPATATAPVAASVAASAPAPSGRVAIGVDCTRTTTAGIFTVSGSSVVPIGPTLPLARAGAAVEVVRLRSYGPGLAALLEIDTASTILYQAAWETSGQGPWTLGPPLTASRVSSASVTAGGGFSLLTGAAADTAPQGAAEIEPGDGTWTTLPSPPAGTATISVAAASTDALAVRGGTFIDYRLRGAQWMAAQTIDVPIAYGSSG